MPDFGQNLTTTITGTFKEIAKPETIIGKEFKMGEIMVVPVISVHLGFGMGGGANKGPENEAGGGGGGGIKVEPVAFLVAHGNEVNLLSVGRGKGLEAVFENMPNLIDKTGTVLKELVSKKCEQTGEEKKENPPPPKGRK